MSRKINWLSSRIYQQNQLILFSSFTKVCLVRNRKICCKGSLYGFCIDLGYFFLCVAFFCFPSGIACKSQREAEEQAVPVKFNSCWGFPVLGWRLDLQDSKIRHTPSSFQIIRARSQRKVSYHWHISSMHRVSSQPVSSYQRLVDYPFKTEILKTQVLMFFL